MSGLHELSAVELREMLSLQEISPTELIDAFDHRVSGLNGALHAFTAITTGQARERAKSLESQAREAGAIPSRHVAPLWGMPFADKDLDEREGVPTTYGSKAGSTEPASASSPLVTDMDRAGGISLGKTNAPEFGFPAYSRNDLPTGFALNPWDLSLDPGGSSSGAATAVASRMLPFAPGSDAGGSVRIPASATGLVGLKTSRGRVPGQSGLGALAGLGVGGPLARSVEDAALLLDGMVKGPNRYSTRAPEPDYMPDSGSFLDAARLPLPRLRIGWNTWSPWASEYQIEVDPQIMAVFEEVLEKLVSLGHRVEEAPLAPTPEFPEAFRAVWMGGAAGLPFTEEALPLLEPLTSWLITTGRGRSASELPRGLSALSAFETRIVADYSRFDVVLTPGLAMTPRPPDWFDSQDGNLNFVQQCQFTPFTSYVNVAGLPAISLPVSQGTSEITGATVPISVQAIGRPGDEATLLRLGRQLEDCYHWQDRIPPGANLREKR